jgi:hypothetical protein
MANIRTLVEADLAEVVAIQASASTTSCVPCFSELRWASMVSSGSLFAKSSK